MTATGAEADAGAGGPALVAIGASTGGPKAVLSILRELPRSFSAPIVVVQHIAEGCAGGFAQWLNRECPLPVRLALQGEAPPPGAVLVAPNGSHLLLDRGRIRLVPGKPVNACLPSIDVFFESLARQPSPRAVGILLTGMGRDGARGMAALRRQGGVTIAQDEASSAIFGMPKAAIQLGGADRVLPLEQIPAALRQIFPEGSPHGAASASILHKP